MKNISITYFSVIFLLFGSCSLFEDKKDDNPNDKLFGGKEIRAKIKLPEGLTAFDPETLKVVSNIGSSPVNKGQFVLGTNGEFTAYFASYSNSEVAMMGYSYPGSTDLDISPRSTALAMVMMTPAVMSISAEGKKALIAKVQNDPAFVLLESEIIKNLKSGRSLFNKNNAGIAQALGQLFSSASARLKNEEQKLSVNVIRSGRSFVFNNKGSAISTVIGIYKDSTRVGKIVVEGMSVVPASIEEIFKGISGNLSDPVAKDFSLQGDGLFKFKYRTGRPGSSIGPEHDEAFYENLFQFSFNLFQTLSSITPSTSCLNSIRAQTFSTIKSISDLKSDTNMEIGTILYIMSTITLDKIEILYGCVGEEMEISWYSKFKKYLEFLSEPSNEIALGANTSIFGIQWASFEPSIDVCFKATGNQVEENEECTDTFIDPRDGNVYQIVKIGNQTWFAENLRYAGNIPNVQSQQAWIAIWNNGNPTGQPAWAYYNNDANNNLVYGKLYNWYAVNTGTLCPQGWRIPTDEEWSILTNFLGGESVAGGKMKSVTDWIVASAGSTNQSGFTALPSGIRDENGEFFNQGSIEHWWSSSPIGFNGAWARDLSGTYDGVYRFAYRTVNGFSCRCLRD